MTEILTRVRVRGTSGGSGFMNWGRRTRPEMIAELRAIATQHAADAKVIIEATDDQFEVAVVRGVNVQRLLEELKP